MPRPDCLDCLGSGMIEVETVHIGRLQYNKQSRRCEYPIEGRGDWHMAQCPCVGEEDDR